jgi:hypothetical protein
MKKKEKMNEEYQKKVKIRAVCFALGCLLLALTVPLLPIWALCAIALLWIPCGCVALAIFTAFLEERFGKRNFYKGFNVLAGTAIILGGTMALIIVPIITRFMKADEREARNFNEIKEKPYDTRT